jgi:hypothetical protein
MEYCLLYFCLLSGANIKYLNFKSWYRDQLEDNFKKTQIYIDDKVKLRRIISNIIRRKSNPSLIYIVYIV